jgi:sporulation protein YlmC with PRC-barrel domain
MIKQHLMLAMLGTALVAAPAFAQSPSSQSSSPSNPPAASTPAPAPSSSSASASTSGSATFISQAQSGQWRASKLVGVDIYGSDNEKIGDVSEVLLDKSGNAQAVVIGVGGFLGVGSKDVAVAFNAIQWKDTPPPSKTSSTSSSSTTGSGSMARPAGNGMTSTSTSKVKDYPDHGELSMTKDQLKAAPEFKYASDTSSTRTDNTRPATQAPSPASK